eukprot:TRINITY_DN2101_c0_g1_i1.p1 TRINITY_DN2101_c0_g1~~TRINITY_DN2101_c0_g1_i1.p1  ORF type:complete len:188 (-),score=12.17 TRINITY_DN2101_c0_g1_i1:27-590(-)
MHGDLHPNFRKKGFGWKNIFLYLKLSSGRLQNEPVVRHRSIFLQMVLDGYFCMMSFMTPWLMSGDSYFSQSLFFFFCAFNILAFIYFTLALYLSLKDNLPRMVSKKNSMGLFLFTLLFFEAGVMTVLFWFLWGVLRATETPLCKSLFCSGLLSGLFAWINVLTFINIAVVWHSRANLGISLADAFGV